MVGVQSVVIVLVDVFDPLFPQALECPSVNSPLLEARSVVHNLIEFLRN